jgi:hypothetical protein
MKKVGKGTGRNDILVEVEAKPIGQQSHWLAKVDQTCQYECKHAKEGKEMWKGKNIK